MTVSYPPFTIEPIVPTITRIMPHFLNDLATTPVPTMVIRYQHLLLLQSSSAGS